MVIVTKDLFVKGILAFGATATATTLGIVYKNEISDALWGGDYPTIIDMVGLNCDSNDECSFNSGEEIRIKQGETTAEIITLASRQSGGKIKLYREENDYKDGFKFVIEGSDITLTGNQSTTKKLEEFEVYEIKEEIEGDGDKKYVFSRKKTADEEKKRILGLPCDLPTTSSSDSECELEAANLNEIVFEGKGEGEVTIGSDGKITPKLKISRETDTNLYPNGYKLVFITDRNISVPKSISIKKNTNTEFKVKKEGTKLALERVWALEDLAKQIGLTNCKDKGGKTECSFGSQINVYGSSTEYLINAEIENNDSEKIIFEENQESYNQGFKFDVLKEIKLTKGSGSGTPIDKLEPSSTYEIKEQTVNNVKN